jgi:hypothetical protein
MGQGHIPGGRACPTFVVDSLGGVGRARLEEPGGFLPENSRFPESVKQRALGRAAHCLNHTPFVGLWVGPAVGPFELNRAAIVLLRVEFLIYLIALFENNILILRLFLSLVLAQRFYIIWIIQNRRLRFYA